MESMTTTTDPLSPERVEAALPWLEDVFDSKMRGERVEFGTGMDWLDSLDLHVETLAALARAHLDATKREPPAGLVEVIAGAQDHNGLTMAEGHMVDGDHDTLAAAIARAVEAFLTSDAAIERAIARWYIHPDSNDEEADMRAAIRAALSAPEACK